MYGVRNLCVIAHQISPESSKREGSLYESTPTKIISSIRERVRERGKIDVVEKLVKSEECHEIGPEWISGT